MFSLLRNYEKTYLSRIVRNTRHPFLSSTFIIRMSNDEYSTFNFQTCIVFSLQERIYQLFTTINSTFKLLEYIHDYLIINLITQYAIEFECKT